jgi:para-nitrobenzyl esterase
VEARQVTAFTACGPVSGVQKDGMTIFRGIPFARPPVGELRFRPPERPASWEQVLDCSTSGPICPQIVAPNGGNPFDALKRSEKMDEDCLYLNVWTSGMRDERRPVMVWIHGGAFLFGSGSSFDGSAFAREDVVLVTMNYRLHALGFLYLDELFSEARGTGNLAILDQIAALSWVRDNIASFGGDPGRVTVFGASAGGLSIGTLMGTPAADGLFQRAILQSGACHFSPSTTAATRVARRVLEVLEVQPGDWRALQSVPVDRIAQAAIYVTAVELAAVMEDEGTALMCFGPVADGTTRPQAHWNLVQSGSARHVDVIVGTTTDEWSRFSVPPGIPDPPIEGALLETGRSVDEMLKVYESGRTDATLRDLKFAAMTDWFFRIPAVRLAEQQLAFSDRVWMYQFSWKSPVAGGAFGACHGLDVPFVFGNLGEAACVVGDNPPVGLSDAIRGAWIRFAADGDPNGGSVPDWPPYDLEDRPIMDFGDTVQVLYDTQPDERIFWEGIR